jgi:hypothetical protein
MFKNTTKLLITLAFLLLISAGHAQADSLSFSNTRAIQNNGNTIIDLFANQGVVLTGPQLDFAVDISGMLPANGSDTLRIVFIEAGQAPQVIQFNIPLLNSVPLPYTQLFSFTLQGTSAQPTNATLLIDILGNNTDFVLPGGTGQLVDSYTYSFQVAQPVPEPATLAFAGLTIAGIITKYHGQSRKKG